MDVDSFPRRTRLLWLAVLTLVLVVVDQASKVYATREWKGAAPIVLFGDLFRVEYAENDGAFLSLLASAPAHVRFWVLTVANGAVLIALAAYLLAARRMHFWTFLPLALVIGGGIGNLIDRVRFGYVIDFFNLGIGNLRTGIFNVADMAITAGFLIMLPLAFLPDPQPQPGADDTSGPGAEPKAASSADRPVESRSA